jgi:E3 ubiquitin-protein ligase RGLG
MGCKQSNTIVINERNGNVGGQLSSTDSEYKGQQMCYDDNFKSRGHLQAAFKKAGLEAAQVMIGIDFTSSNSTQGGRGKFNNIYPHNSLHNNDPNNPNPYKQVMNLSLNTLNDLDQDNMFPAYGFGDSLTTDTEVFPLRTDDNGNEIPSHGVEGVLEAYEYYLGLFDSGEMKMKGPTSFAPIIYKAIETYKRDGEYIVLIIICDGVINSERETINAIVEASNYPISIVTIGVGKGQYEPQYYPHHKNPNYDPWGQMIDFDDNLGEFGIKHDCFQFVDFHAVMRQENQEDAFALAAFQELLPQFKYIKKHYLNKCDKRASGTSSNRNRI